ncbi:MAG: hypothetical protein IPH07_36945 [Deltaproteobacteria bacterium]|nr:hypothetical protein [Deltaproteobacteria bacterium]MBK8713412.1 hypothetical protein [Deltaproteobacteria bacterium]MBP7288037.1 hypothetical protein [Nannocystaceae bacterium]
MNGHRLLFVLCCSTACDLGTASNDDDPIAGESDGGDPSGVSTHDTAGADDTGTAGADDTGTAGVDDTGTVGGDALPDSVLMYLHDDGSWAQSVHAYDVATDQTWLVTDLGGDTQIRSLAIHPDRTTVALAAYYASATPDESEGIWRVPVGGGTPEAIMDPIPGEGAAQDLADLAFDHDGSEIWFTYSNENGGSAIGRAAQGGVPEIFGDANAGCISTHAPSPSPTGAELLALRDGCSDAAAEGLVAHALPPSGAGQVVVPIGDIYEFGGAPSQWSADGSAVMFVLSTRIDVDGDGIYDGQGDTLVAMDTASGQFFEVIPAAIGQLIHRFALSPDELGIALCMGSANGRDLVLLDLHGESATYRQLTDDGASCHMAW